MLILVDDEHFYYKFDGKFVCKDCVITATDAAATINNYVHKCLVERS